MADTPPRLSLTLVQSGNSVISWVLPATVEPRIGRDPACNDVVLHDPTVSRSHGRIYASDDAWSLSDFGSKKGTFVNGERVVDTRPLTHGDIVEVGPYVLLVEFGETVKETVPEASEKTQRLELERCPRCNALALDFDTCMRCGHALRA